MIATKTARSALAPLCRGLLAAASALPWCAVALANDPVRPAAASADSAWVEQRIAPEARDFWSFRRLGRVVPPPVNDAGWCLTEVDRFVRARQEAAGVAPNPPAWRTQLARRAWFDLLGLPPPPGELAEFLEDQAPDAWERLIDRLLASPHFGERWARHWLDLARFGESHGFEHDYDRPAAYHYRDFVIAALNDDLPYDTFVKWQIAGDELEPASNLALAATGFLAAGVHSTQITANEVEKHRYDELDDMLSTIGSAMLGLSLNCARCHDHKYDPLPQRDYYRLLSIFTTTVRSEIDLEVDPEGYRRSKAAFDARHAPLVEALARYEAGTLPARFDAWESAGGAAAGRFPWLVVEPESLKAEGGATFAPQEDGSYLTAGANPRFDSYTFVFRANPAQVRGLRVEALAHPALPKGGPGRADNGNFDLTDLVLTVANPQGQAPAVRAALRNARASFEQAGLPIAAAIDEDPRSGWAVDPQFGKDHAAAFSVELPEGLPDESLFTLVLTFQGNDRHGIGRLRVAVCQQAEPPALQADSMPASVAAALATPAAQRGQTQRELLLRWYARALDGEWRTRNAAVMAHLAQAPKPALVKALISTEGLPPVRLHTQGVDFLEQTHFLKRGDPAQKVGVATPGFLQVLMPSSDADALWQEAAPPGARTSFRRKALANWLTDVDRGAGHLLARVIVNRVWQHHFGQGIVATPNDFGARGAPPLDPELLDWLAGRLIAGGWRLKSLHKLLMCSAVYQQSAAHDPARAAIDPRNRLLWRRTPRRLEAEIIRDGLLAVAGRLDPTLFGPGALEAGSRRRSVYLTVKRSKLVPMLQVFDAPDALTSQAERPSTTVAPQALLMMNNPLVRLCAQSLAARVAEAGGAPRALSDLWLAALSRHPTREELEDAQRFLEMQRRSYPQAGVPEPASRAMVDLCHALLCLNEFVFVD